MGPDSLSDTRQGGGYQLAAAGRRFDQNQGDALAVQHVDMSSCVSIGDGGCMQLTGTEITLAPPPYMTPFLQKVSQELSFPPRFGEHNEEIYGGALGLSSAELKELKEKGVI